MNYEDRVTKEYLENALAGARVKIATGTYTGNGQASQFIDLGFTPKAVLVLSFDGRLLVFMGNAHYCYGGLALTGHPAACNYNNNEVNIVSIVEGGFNVSYIDAFDPWRYFIMANAAYQVMHYIAIA